MAQPSYTGKPIESTAAASSRTEATKSSITLHTTDPFLAAFLGPTFDPTAYLNSVLPPLAIATTQQPIIPAKSATLADVAGQASEHLATLSAHQARLTAALTTVTDEILRSGARLAYEVEILRGDAAALEDVLDGEEVRRDLERFVIVKSDAEQNGEGTAAASTAEQTRNGADESQPKDITSTTPAAAAAASPETATDKDPTTTTATITDPLAPQALSRLRTLRQVRHALTSVRSVFDAALLFPLPPSLLASATSTTSFVSVVAPTDPALEAAGQEAVARLRASVVEHFDPHRPGGTASAAGVARAEARLAELRDLCTVWRGTAEERARAKLLDAWEREVGEARERLGGGSGADDGVGGESRQSGDGYAYGARARAGREESVGGRARSSSGSREAPKERKGLFGGLRRLRDEIYLD